MKTIEHFGSYVADLSTKLQRIRQKQEEERKKLSELRALLRSAPGLDKEASTPSGGPPGTEKGGGYSLHQLQGDKHAGLTRTGEIQLQGSSTLMNQSNVTGNMRNVFKQSNKK